MKRLKLKGKVKNSSSKESKNTVSTHERILNDPSSINDLNIIIKEFVEYLQSYDCKKLDVSFKNIGSIFKKYLDKKQNFLVNQDLLNFLFTKIRLLIDLLIESIDLDEEEGSADILMYIFSLFTYNDEIEYQRQCMIKIIDKLFLTEKLLDNSIIDSINNNIVNSFYVETLFNTLYDRMNECSISHKNSFYNIYNFLILLDNNIQVQNVNMPINIKPSIQFLI